MSTKKPRLTDEDVVNLIDCAGYGITSWAASAVVDPEAKTYRVTESEEVADDSKNPLARTLSFDEIRTAFATLAEEKRLPEWQMREIAEDDLGFDAMVGDMTIQQAMYGKLVFS